MHASQSRCNVQCLSSDMKTQTVVQSHVSTGLKFRSLKARKYISTYPYVPATKGSIFCRDWKQEGAGKSEEWAEKDTKSVAQDLVSPRFKDMVPAADFRLCATKKARTADRRPPTANMMERNRENGLFHKNKRFPTFSPTRLDSRPAPPKPSAYLCSIP
jgi:hypothetical protein